VEIEAARGYARASPGGAGPPAQGEKAMLEGLGQQFLGSGAGSELVQAVTQQHGMNEGEAKQAVEATVDGAAQAVSGQGGGGLGALTGALSGGGIGGMLSGVLAGGVPEGVSNTIADFVAKKTGLPADKARSVVAMALPKVLEFVRGKMGGGQSGGGQGGGGMLGGLFG